jgi:hypothetical protein
MKKVITIFMSLMLMVVIILSNSLTVQGARELQDQEYAWVLVEVIDIDAADKIAKTNKDYEGVYHHEGNYSRNNFSYTQTYIGPTDDYYDPPTVHGESISIMASFSELPQVIYPDWEIAIQISLSAADNHSYYNPGAGVKAQISKNDQAYRDFTNADGEGFFRSDIKNNYASINETVTTIAPAGSEGDTLEIKVYMSFGHKMETRYIYEWKEASETEQEQPKPTPSDETPTATTQPYTETLPEGCVDSGIRFSDLAGEVLIRPHDDILAWDMAELGMVVCNMDHIKTSYDSIAFLSLRDMSTLSIRPECEVIVDVISEEESKIALLAGKVWVNVKKMLKDGEMNIEMSQAVAGIKGTTFILEETGSTSTVKVLEGTVEFTPYGQSPIIVSDEETVSVTNGIAGSIEKFSIEEELNNWDDQTASAMIDALREKGRDIDIDEENSGQQNPSKFRSTIIILILVLCLFSFGLAAVAIVVFFVVRANRKAKGNAH